MVKLDDLLSGRAFGFQTEWCPVLQLVPGDNILWWTSAVQVVRVFKARGLAHVVVSENGEISEHKYKTNDQLQKIISKSVHEE